MSRWHDASCTAPDVYVDGEIPRRRACDTAPDLKAIIARDAKSSAPPQAPPDEAIGQMNLHWPPSVPYRRLQGSRDVESDAVNSSTSEPSPQPSPRLTPPLPIPPSFVYGSTLNRDQIRLICIDPAINDRESSPIHINLEVHSNDGGPEYEALSYAWGGENGDSSQTWPLFIGPYWDVMLQTKNCWDALRYLRPYRGIRLLWVDAVCINQNDQVEKVNQISKMGEIYNRCMRTIVWLSENVAEPDHAAADRNMYPARRSIKDLVTGNACGTTTIEQLLKLRYFQRIWIIQELILPPELVIPIQGKEVSVNHARLKEVTYSWGRTTTPWFDRVCTGTSFLFHDLGEVVQQTWVACATDPRDKAFGTLGLISGHENAHIIKPDYSLSGLHVKIGAVAYVILNFKNPGPLLGCLNRTGNRTMPSWLPAWNDPIAAENAWRMGNLSRRYPLTGFWSDVCRSDTEATRINVDIEKEVAENGGYVILLRNRKADGRGWTRSLCQTHPAARFHQDGSVDPTTGALSINAVHLFDFNTTPVPLGPISQSPDGHSLQIFKINMRESCLLLLIAGDVPLDSSIAPGKIEVFTLVDEANDSFILLFLRRTSPEDDFLLIFSCVCDDILVYPHMNCICDKPETCPSLNRHENGTDTLRTDWKYQETECLTVQDRIQFKGGSRGLVVGRTPADVIMDIGQLSEWTWDPDQDVLAK